MSKCYNLCPEEFEHREHFMSWNVLDYQEREYYQTAVEIVKTYRKRPPESFLVEPTPRAGPPSHPRSKIKNDFFLIVDI